jgi:hypothetical protein
MPATDAVRLTVSEIRQKIFEASSEPSRGMGALPGKLFHRAAECALRAEHPAFWQDVLTRELNAKEWARTLYDHALGPELTKSQSALRDNGAEVLQLWRAVESFAKWFCRLLEAAIQRGAIRYDERKEKWVGSESLFKPECDLTKTLREPEWTADVIVAGRADHLLRVAEDRWCVIEFKLGRGHAESDAAQACLYHELLGGGPGSAALVRFNGETEPHELLLESDWIAEARPKLLSLIGALARVTPEDPQDHSDPEPPRMWPKPAGEAEKNLGKRVIQALEEFKADARLAAEPLVGPTFVRFLLEPGRGVAASKIEKQGPNLQLRLQLKNEPMIGRSEGRIAVDVQRPDRESVPFFDLRGVLESKRNSAGNSHVLAGLDLKGKVEFIDLARDTPHLLVGGMPGSGKSEWLRSAVASLLVTNTPDKLRLVLVDPKKNAFAELAGSEYLWRPDALLDSPEGRVIPMLTDLIEEMLRRYELFKQAIADDLASYRQKTGMVLPRLVCVVDEFSELLMGGKKAERAGVEDRFIRIAQMGRAAGVHLILATQRPSRQVVSGVLKANIPGKVALRVATRVESGVLLDQNGAQNLLGKGDLLLAAGSNLVRLQSAFLSEDDRRRIFKGERAAPPSNSTGR